MLMSASAVKTLRWVFFGVMISLLPLFYSYQSLTIRSQVASWDKIIGNGELLVIIWALCAGAIGELFGATPNYAISKVISGAAALLVLILSALLFADVTGARAAGAKIDEVVVVSTSIWLLVFGIISCASCVALSET